MKKTQTQVSIGFLVNEDGQILLGLRAPWKKVRPNDWDGIGGRLEDGESASDALVREVQEEVGVTPSGFELVTSAVQYSNDIGVPYQLNIFVVRGWFDGTPRNISDEHSEIRWFSFEEVRALPNIAFLEQLASLAAVLS